MKTEKLLWDILKQDYNFTNHPKLIPKNWYESIRNIICPKIWLGIYPIRFIDKTSDDWLSTTINGNFYEVFMIDMWYVVLKKNGEVIFDARRFENEEFLKLIL